MIRIFLVLASLDGLALCASVVLGTLSKLRGSQANEADQVWMYHFYCGLGSAMLNLMVHSLIFTYFLGGGRLRKEVALAYLSPDEPYPKLTRELKRWTFPPALAAMLITIATTSAGAGAMLHDWHWTIHASLAAVTLLVNGGAFVIEARNVRTNAMVIEKVREEAERVRREQGLPPSEEELAREAR